MTDPVGLRERKKRERRHRIEDAALDLFEQHGYDSTTVDAIAAAADIAPRTFFHYFHTKEDVVLANYANRLERIGSELATRPITEAPWAALRASFLVVAADYQTDREPLIRRFAIMASTPSVFARNLQLQAGWEDTIAHALAHRLDTDGIEPRLLAAASLAALRSALGHWIHTNYQQPLPELVIGCFDRLGTGLDQP